MPTVNFRHSHNFLMPDLTRDNSRNTRLLFGIRILRELANKFSLFFLPVFLFLLGRDQQFLAGLNLTPFQSGLVLMAAYLGGVKLVALALIFPAGGFIRRHGFAPTLVLSQLLYAVMLIALQFSMQNLNWLWMGIIADGVCSVLMWGSFNTLFAKIAPKNHVGKELGLVQALLNLTWLVAPVLSGVVIYLFGYELLFTTGLIFAGLALVLAVFLTVSHERDSISWHELSFWLKEPRFLKLSLSIAGKTFYDLAIFIWPLYVFLLLGNTEQVGLLYSFSFFISMFLSFLIGSKLDRDDRKGPFFFSGGFLSVLWLVRAQLVQFWSIMIVDAFDKLAGNYHWLFFDRMLWSRGKGKQAFSYFMYREVIISSTCLIFWLLFTLMFLIWPLEWKGFFALASFGVLLSLLIGKKHEEV